jgi:hypothetical protein
MSQALAERSRPERRVAATEEIVYIDENRMFALGILAGPPAIPQNESHRMPRPCNRAAGGGTDQLAEFRVILRLFILLRCFVNRG